MTPPLYKWRAGKGLRVFAGLCRCTADICSQSGHETWSLVPSTGLTGSILCNRIELFMRVHNTIFRMKAQANGIELEYESIGDPRDPTLLLIMGFSVQMIAWDDELCRLLADRGFRVVRFDNRDVGLSSKITGGSYTLDDMAGDARGLLEWLGVQSAHVVGASMGGMIAQLLAIHWPARVRSLCSIMSTTGDPLVGQPTPQSFGALMRAPPATREEAIQ